MNSDEANNADRDPFGPDDPLRKPLRAAIKLLTPSSAQTDSSLFDMQVMARIAKETGHPGIARGDVEPPVPPLDSPAVLPPSAGTPSTAELPMPKIPRPSPRGWRRFRAGLISAFAAIAVVAVILVWPRPAPEPVLLQAFVDPNNPYLSPDNPPGPDEFLSIEAPAGVNGSMCLVKVRPSGVEVWPKANSECDHVSAGRRTPITEPNPHKDAVIFVIITDKPAAEALETAAAAGRLDGSWTESGEVRTRLISVLRSAGIKLLGHSDGSIRKSTPRENP